MCIGTWERSNHHLVAQNLYNAKNLFHLNDCKNAKISFHFSHYFLDTSRPSRPGEIHGKDYFFENREQMQLDIEGGKFIEHGEYRGNLYGTSVDGIRDFIQAGYQPIISPHYQVFFAEVHFFKSNMNSYVILLFLFTI